MRQWPDSQLLWQWIQYQQQQIDDLKKRIRSLQQEAEEWRSRPPVVIDTIEYSFDQLKVEKLEGTLNIGLNPAELSQVKDLDLPSSSLSQQTAQPALLDASIRFIDHHLDDMINDFESQLQRSLDPQMKEHIRKDLIKQLPQRIGYYHGQCRNEPPEIQEETVLSKIKNDVQQALFAFMSKIPETE
ncbi:spore germination protein GerPC [Bacillus xiapuensis]|uniref:spore germination protein GerPC n=1 Tax=Bacillus xiapuensis TaxID=2014075 RepID=UPI000C24ABBA|nr:spore germination protein GerPC [Bacillus xiapuensis]